jgi:CheY-like chemotaxis protein
MTDKPNRQETILIVEDEVLIRMPIAHCLRDCGYKVIEAANADEAMAVLTHKDTVLDIVFTDIEMVVDGFGAGRLPRADTTAVNGVTHTPLMPFQYV